MSWSPQHRYLHISTVHANGAKKHIPSSQPSDAWPVSNVDLFLVWQICTHPEFRKMLKVTWKNTLHTLLLVRHMLQFRASCPNAKRSSLSSFCYPPTVHNLHRRFPTWYWHSLIILCNDLVACSLLLFWWQFATLITCISSSWRPKQSHDSNIFKLKSRQLLITELNGPEAFQGSEAGSGITKH